jgi:cytochrome c peroxidase
VPNVPENNAATAEKAFLGNQLFHDKRLSLNENMSCASCHLADKALTDGVARAVDHAGKQMSRNSPSLYNIAYRESLYWDGRAPNLETQALAPTKAFMGFMDPAPLVERISKIRGYRQQFEAVFGAQGAEPSAENIRFALAAYERTLLAGNSAYDRFQAGDRTALNKVQQRCLKLFNGKAACGGCHSGPMLSDGLFHDIGVDWGRPGVTPDPGRFNATQTDTDGGAFRTPSLRDVARTAPYFHDGSAATLEAAVDFTVGGGHPRDNPNFDTKNMRRVRLRASERAALLAFLRALNSDTVPTGETPWLPTE